MEEQMVAPMMIKEHMEVLGSDGVHVGTVDHLEGRDQMKLTKTDTDADGEHHFIPLAWVDRRRRARAPQAIRRRGKGAVEDPLTLAGWVTPRESPAAIWLAGFFTTGRCARVSLQGLVPALVVERTGRGSQHFTEILGVGPGFVGVARPFDCATLR